MHLTSLGAVRRDLRCNFYMRAGSHHNLGLPEVSTRKIINHCPQLRMYLVHDRNNTRQAPIPKRVAYAYTICCLQFFQRVPRAASPDMPSCWTLSLT